MIYFVCFKKICLNNRYMFWVMTKVIWGILNQNISVFNVVIMIWGFKEFHLEDIFSVKYKYEHILSYGNLGICKPKMVFAAHTFVDSLFLFSHTKQPTGVFLTLTLSLLNWIRWIRLQWTQQKNSTRVFHEHTKLAMVPTVACPVLSIYRCIWRVFGSFIINGCICVDDKIPICGQQCQTLFCAYY